MDQIALFDERVAGLDAPTVTTVDDEPQWSCGDVEFSPRPLANRDGCARALAELHEMMDLRAAEESVRNAGLETLDQLVGDPSGRHRHLAFFLSHPGARPRAAWAATEFVLEHGYASLLRDPYQLMRPEGELPFSFADGIAGAVGVSSDSELRFEAAVRWLLFQAKGNGESVIGRRAAKGRLGRILGDKELADAALRFAVDSGAVNEKGGRVWDPVAARARALLDEIRAGRWSVEVHVPNHMHGAHRKGEPQLRPEGVIVHPGLWIDVDLIGELEELRSRDIPVRFLGDPRWTTIDSSLSLAPVLARASGWTPKASDHPGNVALTGKRPDLQEGRCDDLWYADVGCRGIGADGFPLDGSNVYAEEHKRIRERLVGAVEHFRASGGTIPVVHCLQRRGPLAADSIQEWVGDDAEVICGPGRNPLKCPRIVLWHISDQRMFTPRLFGTLLSLPSDPTVILSTQESIDFTFTGGRGRDSRMTAWSED